MNRVFAGQPMPQTMVSSIFLAGPSPRDNTTLDWRHEALAYLDVHFDGTVFIPIPEHRFHGGDGDSAEWTYDGQIDWECQARAMADIILFWVPRDIAGKMPAFTTNVEFGEDLHSGKIVYGRPPQAEKNRYLDLRIRELGLPVWDTLSATLGDAIQTVREGALRIAGETQVPLFIWRTEAFQGWYESLKAAGNRLDGAKLLHHAPLVGKVWCFTLATDIWIAAEGRNKSNEFIVSRPDTGAVVAYYQEDEMTLDASIVLVKEFRSAVNNAEGYVIELPGGSHAEPPVGADGLPILGAEGALINAQTELLEETGIFIEDPHRFEFVEDRQLLSTLTTHRTKLYAVRLRKAEYEQALANAQQKSLHGVESDGERTQVVVAKRSEVMSLGVDFSTLGMIASVFV